MSRLSDYKGQIVDPPEAACNLELSFSESASGALRAYRYQIVNPPCSESAGDFSLASLDLLLWLEARDLTTITLEDGYVSVWADKSGNGNDAVQVTASQRFAVATEPDRLVKRFSTAIVDMVVNFTTAPTTAHLVQSSSNGVFTAVFAIPNGAWSFVKGAVAAPTGDVIDMVVTNGLAEAGDLAKIATYMGKPASNFANQVGFNSWFSGRSDLLEADVSDWAMGSATDLLGFVANCGNLTELDVSAWVTGPLTRVEIFANGCGKLTALNPAGFNTSAVVSFRAFAARCGELVTLEVGNWDTGNGTNFSEFAYSCQKLNTLEVGNWDTANATNFYRFAMECREITALPVANWNTGNVTSFQAFVYNCLKLTSLPVANWNTGNVSTFYQFAAQCRVLPALDVTGWDTSGVVSFYEFAYFCQELTALPVANWDTSNVVSFYRFVAFCYKLTSLPVANWDTSNVTTFREFAYACLTLTALPVANWDTANVASFQRFVRSCQQLSFLDVSGWVTLKVTSFRDFAANCTALTTVVVNGGTGNPFADSPCTNYSGAFTNTNLTTQSIDDILVAVNAAGTSNGSFGHSGGQGPSSVGIAAADAMRARGWTVTTAPQAL